MYYFKSINEFRYEFIDFMEEFLRIFYDSMKWIEATTSDLHYSLREIEAKLLK